ncbi:MAG: lipase family protein [Longimicrobiaceae bacterium]
MSTPAPDPCTMMKLSSIAYSLLPLIPGEVKKLGQEVVWGPAELGLIPSSAAYIAHDSGSGAYTVVIRGTDPASWSSWTGEDFDILPVQPFNQFVTNAPSGAMISAGTYDGLNDLLKLSYSGSGIAGFLQSKQPTLVYVTGHSLGGTLTPPLFAYLSAELPGVDMAPCSFAGLTPGNADFNDYFTGLFNASGSWRYYNTLDFAPLCWGSSSGVQNIYTEWGLTYGKPESDLLDPLFQQAQTIPLEQPALGGAPLQGTFDDSIIDKNIWTAQALHQHHHQTYQTLVCSGS